MHAMHFSPSETYGTQLRFGLIHLVWEQFTFGGNLPVDGA